MLQEQRLLPELRAWQLVQPLPAMRAIVTNIMTAADIITKAIIMTTIIIGIANITLSRITMLITATIIARAATQSVDMTHIMGGR
jgi:multisubunit Na+/H+ antiporter MnhC subunit